MPMKREAFIERLEDHIVRHGFAIIAEIGQNHQGSVDIALALARTFAEMPAVFAIKSVIRDLGCVRDPNRERSGRNSFGDTELKHRTALELTEMEHWRIADECQMAGKLYGLSCVDHPSLDWIQQTGWVDFLKVPSQRIKDDAFLSAVNFDDAVVMSFGGLSYDEAISCANRYHARAAVQMHCVMGYPSPIPSMNVARCFSLFGHAGLSSHCQSTIPDLVAVGCGARVFEHHVTFDKCWPGSDHSSSLDVEDMRKLCRDLKDATDAYGSVNADVQPCEWVNIEKLRGE